MMRLRALALLLVSIAFSIGAAEVATRLLLPQYDPADQIRFSALPDGTPIGPFGATRRQRKNTGDYDVSVSFNELGLRDDKLPRDARPTDWFVVGDSFPFGWGVSTQERLSERLARALGSSVFNISVPGADLDGYAALVRYAQDDGADVKQLVITVTMENDLADYETAAGLSQDEPHRAYRPSGSHLLSSGKSLLTEHSALYGLTTRAVHQTPLLRHLAIHAGLITGNLSGMTPLLASQRAIAASADRVGRLAAARTAIILLVPSRRLWTGSVQDRAAADAVHTAFSTALRDRDLEIVDPRARFEEGGNPLAYHFRNDGHWNGEGHRLAAEILADAIRRHTSASAVSQ